MNESHIYVIALACIAAVELIIIWVQRQKTSCDRMQVECLTRAASNLRTELEEAERELSEQAKATSAKLEQVVSGWQDNYDRLEAEHKEELLTCIAHKKELFAKIKTDTETLIHNSDQISEYVGAAARRKLQYSAALTAIGTVASMIKACVSDDADVEDVGDKRDICVSADSWHPRDGPEPQGWSALNSSQRRQLKQDRGLSPVWEPSNSDHEPRCEGSKE